MNSLAFAVSELSDKTESISENDAGTDHFWNNIYLNLKEDTTINQTYKPVIENAAPWQDIEIKWEPYEKPSIPCIHPKERAHDSYAILQEWEGYVVVIRDATFVARLTDITKSRSAPQEEAEFPFEELSDSDRKNLCEGAIFRWIIAYRRSPGGTKERASRIVFRNLPAWTKRDIEKNEKDAAEWAEKLKFK